MLTMDETERSGKDPQRAGQLRHGLPADEHCAEGHEAGRVFHHVIGPYDYWAIEYGYKPVPGPEAEVLAKIAARGVRAVAAIRHRRGRRRLRARSVDQPLRLRAAIRPSSPGAAWK